MTEEELRRHRVGELVKWARLEGRLSISAAARLAGIDRATWTGVEKATRLPRDTQRAAIEAAVGLPLGTISRLLDGLPPQDSPHGLSDDEPMETRATIMQATPDQLVEMQDMIEEVMGRRTANEFLKRAIELRSRPNSPIHDKRQSGQGDHAAG
jgi:transcriptional regulator with XRE-family HTH domain